MSDVYVKSIELKEPIIEHRVLLMSVANTYRKGMTEEEILIISKQAWQLSGKRRDKPSYAFAVYRGKVKAVFTIFFWNDNEDDSSRSTFNGEIAPPDIRDRYIGMSVHQYRKKGSKGAFLYVNC